MSSTKIRAIKVLDEIFAIHDVFNLSHQSLSELRDPYLIETIIEYVSEEEYKFKKGQTSIFDLGKSTQTSYPRRGFCSAAIKQMGAYIHKICIDEATNFANESTLGGQVISTQLLERFKINNDVTERERIIKQRIGQNIFRDILLNIYESKCCVTGLDVPEVLRASHIIPWADDKENRLNPENGLCLSATYDAAFDQHLITFDEEYRRC